MDSTNVGAIFRSAAALNMDAVLINPSCCDPLCRRAVRVSMGTVFQVPWATSVKLLLIGPKRACSAECPGFKTAAMALSDRSVSIDDEALPGSRSLPLCWARRRRPFPYHHASCDYTVKIPMSHGVDSLNVAAASAVAFWQLGKQ